MLLETTLILLPSFLFMNWAARLLHLKGKSRLKTGLTGISILGAISFFGDASGLVPNIDYREYTVMIIVMQATSFLLATAFNFYLYAVEGKHPSKLYIAMSVLVPLLMTATTLWMVSRNGLAETARYLEAYDMVGAAPEGLESQRFEAFGFVTRDLHNILLGGNIVWLWGRLLAIMISKGIRPYKLIQFMMGQKKEPQENIMCLLAALFFLLYILRVIAGRGFMLVHPVLLCLLYTIFSVLIANAMFIGYWYEGRALTLEGENNTEVQNTNDVLQKRIKSYIEDEKAYLDPGLSIEKVASALSTNRTYVSDAIGRMTGKGFREYINTLRIEAAKEELTAHPDLRLDAIAEKSGFTGGSQLVKKFKEITGYTPKAWSKGK